MTLPFKTALNEKNDLLKYLLPIEALLNGLAKKYAIFGRNIIVYPGGTIHIDWNFSDVLQLQDLGT